MFSCTLNLLNAALLQGLMRGEAAPQPLLGTLGTAASTFHDKTGTSNASNGSEVKRMGRTA